MATTNRDPIVTEDRLIQHRLEQLERLGEGWLEAQRRMDTLGISQGAMEKMLTEIQTEMRTRDERTHGSLARLHSRLDEFATAESFEKGRVAGAAATSMRTGKIVAVTLTITIAFCALVVAILTLAGVAPG